VEIVQAFVEAALGGTGGERFVRLEGWAAPDLPSRSGAPEKAGGGIRAARREPGQCSRARWWKW